jgi:predicted dehydrogenase
MMQACEGGQLGAPLSFRSERLSPVGSRDPDGSLLWSLAPHDISLLCALGGGGSPVLSLEGRQTVSGQLSAATLRGRIRGMLATVQLSRVHHEKVRRIVIECEGGELQFDDQRSADKLLLVRGKSVEVIAYEASGSPLQAELGQFVRCVRSGVQPSTGFEEGLAVVRCIAELLGRSNQAGARPPELDAR